MNQYKTSRLIVGTSVIIVLSAAMLFFTVNQGYSIPFVSDGIRTSVGFLNELVAKPVQFLSEQKDVISKLISTYQENQELKATVETLESELAESETLKNENESLRHNLSMSETYGDKQLFSGLVTVRTPNLWSNQLAIDLGKNDGISENMLVLANGGLVGTIQTVDDESSTVKLLTNSDDFTKLSVKITSGSTLVYGILSGYDTDKNAFIIEQLNSTDAIEEGSNVVTSDLAGTTPSNIQLGTVISVESDSNQLNRKLYVSPTASFSNIYAVIVVGNA